MPRRTARPFGQSITAQRGVSMLMALLLIGMLYQWTRNPATWAWLAAADDDLPVVQAPEAQDAPAEKKAKPKVVENIVPGPNDLVAEEVAKFKEKLPLVTDNTELKPREMSAYWQLMGWARTEPIKQFEKRANATTTFAQIFSEPTKFRGKPLRLRMHVRRVLEYDAPENPLRMKKAYEIWGWTDDSMSNPYCVVVPELPPGIRVGPDSRGEVVFVGYLLKLMAYTAGDAKRRTPLMLGRIRGVTGGVVKEDNSYSILLIIVAVVVGLVCTLVAVRHLFNFRRRPSRSMLPDTIENGETLAVLGSGADAQVNP